MSDGELFPFGSITEKSCATFVPTVIKSQGPLGVWIIWCINDSVQQCIISI